MKRIQLLLLAIGLAVSTTALGAMSTSKVRKETRFLTDKMAYELSLSTPQYNDVYEINYDFIYSVRNIMNYVVRGEEWAMEDYYEALDIRNDDLRWVLSDAQYRRFLNAEYFYRPVYITGGKWNFRIYINYPNRGLFYYGVPYHYRTYCGAHYRPHIHYTSYYRDRYTNFGHYSAAYRVRDQRVYQSHRRSDFGSVNIRPNTTVRPGNAPTRPGVSQQPNRTNRPNTSTPNRQSERATRPRNESGQRPSNTNRPSTSTPSRDNRPNKDFKPGSSSNEGSSSSGVNRRPANTNTERNKENGSSTTTTTNRDRSSNSSRNNSESGRGSSSSSRSSNESGQRNSESNRGSSSSSRSSSESSRSSSPSRNSSESSRSSTPSRSSSESNRGSSSSRSNVSSKSESRSSSSERTKSNSSRDSSRSSERGNSSRK